MRDFKVGDDVTWQSQAAGSWLTKRGKVIAVVEAGIPPNHALYLAREKEAADEFSGVWARKEQSYIVRVERVGKRRPAIYWPRASALRLVYDKPMATTRPQPAAAT